MISGQAQMVGLLPVFGAFSISSYSRGLPRLWPSDSIRMPHAPDHGQVRPVRWTQCDGHGAMTCDAEHMFRSSARRRNTRIRSCLNLLYRPYLTESSGSPATGNPVTRMAAAA